MLYEHLYGMKTIRLSDTYNAKWQIKGYENYSITTCGRIINTRTNRMIKMCLKGYTKGYNIGGKFMTLETINKLSFIHKPIICPF